MRTALVVLAAALTVGLSACGGDDDKFPYTADEMEAVRHDCSVDASLHIMAGAAPGSFIDCLRSGLPALSDEQLERIDYVIETARD